MAHVWAQQSAAACSCFSTARAAKPKACVECAVTVRRARGGVDSTLDDLDTVIRIALAFSHFHISVPGSWAQCA